MEKVAIVVGATGLVGQHLLAQLLSRPEFDIVRVFVRRETGLIHPKLDEQIIDFDKPESWRSMVRGDVLFSTMGTTIKLAKTKENQYKVDFSYQYEFAKAASENGVPVYVLVSSIGANSRSSVFYTRMKGQLEDAISSLKFRKQIIFRPSILEGDREEKRVGEKIGLIASRIVTQFIMKDYRPTPADLLAATMIRLSLVKTEGYQFVEGRKIFTT